MRINKTLVEMAAVMALFAGTAQADPVPNPTITVTGGTIHFKGKLVSAPCAVSTDSDGQTIKLGEYTTHHFSKRGVMGSLTPFQIKLEDCDTTIASTAAVAFSGRQDATDSTLLAIDAGLSGDNKTTATGVGIRIKDEKTQAIIPDGKSFSTPHTLIDGENILNFIAQYKSTAAATAGDANADATFIMQYQ